MNVSAVIAEGNTANIYLHENKIIKVFKEHSPSNEALWEANKQKYAYSCGLPVPEVLDVTEINGKQAIIMEYVQGRTIGGMMQEDMPNAEYYISISVDVQRKIHAVHANSIEHMSEKLSRQIQSAPILGDERKTFLLEKLAAMKIDDNLCHGDFHVFNVIGSNGNVAVIDWVDATAGDIRADVCRSWLLYSQLSVELADMYVRLYCRKSGLSKEEIFEWAPIVAGARLSENVLTENADRLLAVVDQYTLKNDKGAAK